MPAAPEGDGTADQAGFPTPPRVLEELQLAFGENLVGETGYDLAATRCCSDEEKSQAKERGSSLLYGELLPDGVTKAMSGERLGKRIQSSQANPGAIVLELGSGSGKVAMQTWLQYPNVAHCLGVELVPSRYEISAKAVRQLVSKRPEAYRLVDPTPVPSSCPPGAAGEAICMQEIGGHQRKLEFRCADFFAVGLESAAKADVIFFAVHIPCKLFPQLASTLLTAKEGCRIFSYHSLGPIWWCQKPSPFKQVPINIPESDTFSTSWSPQGYRFYIYECDRTQTVPEIPGGGLNETFSEWQPMQDEASQKWYYHNHETEESQWEMPTQAGCWQAIWSPEWNAHFYHHVLTGHTQWE
eukprot:CAMPEP_0206472200 /NCGR_PEP_ID=MMETSP0324_2-20121206/32044_1 /ASSEMBLY_ACC=CAM_ASM_000836 /TAXON_ID=2866 /ORGANISM="Crypthecodinium cohnii, Strain Seligo" /LENGTH=354 /DNA_ID=CAMNT_0053946725 /DNA_START=294 /DNA_END=1355 /DNA_ORIENTATION=+